MQQCKRFVAITLILAAGFALAGCYSSSDKDKKKQAGHPTEGLHEGVLIELGDEEYHGEFLPDHKTKTATVWILDAAVKKQVPIDAKTLKLFIEKEDKTKVEIELKAEREDSDPKDKSSRFTGTHAILAEERPYVGEVVVIIDGKSFRGGFDESKVHKH